MNFGELSSFWLSCYSSYGQGGGSFCCLKTKFQKRKNIEQVFTTDYQRKTETRLKVTAYPISDSL